MDAVRMSLLGHARTHSVEMQRGDNGALNSFLRGPADERHLGDRLEDAALFGLNNDQLRIVPKEGQNSIAWLLWHMARTEDAMMSVIVGGRPQVISEGWMERLKASPLDVGAGMSDDAVSDFTEKVDVAALRAYRAAVGRQTADMLASMRPDDLERDVDPKRIEEAMAQGVLGDNVGWVREFWTNRSNAWCVTLVTGHNYLHLGEAFCVRSQAGLSLGV